MRSFEDRWNEIRKDPERLKRLFTVVWVIAYSMLIFGFLLIVWVLLASR